MKKLITLIVLFFSAVTIAQNNGVDFTANVSKKKLGINQLLQVEFAIKNTDGDNFTSPDFNGFRVVAGPMQTVSNTWINGVRSFSRSYKYTLQPTSRGKFTIGQATIEVGGKMYKTSPIEIEVTAAVEDPNATPGIDETVGDNLHLVAEISNANPYLNQGVSVVYKLYVSPTIDVNNFDFLDDPKYNNFWSQDIRLDGYHVENVMYENKRYRMVVLKKVVLYPQQSGKLEIEPLSLDVSVAVPTNKRNFFGGMMYENTHKVVSAGTRTLNVKPLPEAGKPEDFSGAVGKFNFEVTVSRDSLKGGESLQAKVKVSGTGNLKLLTIPKLTTPSALETYDPEYDEQVNIKLSGMEGSVAENYTIVSRYKGKYPLQPVSFTYFDPEAGKYKTITSKEIEINVTEGLPNGSATVLPNSPGNKQEVVTLGNDFRFIKIQPHLIAKGKRDYFYKSTLFYILLLAPLLLIPIAVLGRNKREAYLADVAGSKIRKANKLARKYLSAARKALGDKESFYIALEKALHNYLKAKLHIETSEFSKDKIRELLRNKGVDLDIIEEFVGLLESCELARYSPATEVTMQHDYEKAAAVITKMDKQI